MSFVSKEIIPILEKELLNVAPDISEYLLNNAEAIAKLLIDFVEKKIDSTKDNEVNKNG